MLDASENLRLLHVRTIVFEGVHSVCQVLTISTSSVILPQKDPICKLPNERTLPVKLVTADPAVKVPTNLCSHSDIVVGRRWSVRRK